MMDVDEEVLDHGPTVKKLTPGEFSDQLFPPELSLFEEPPLLAAIASEEFVDYRPNSGSLNNGSLDYEIPMSSTQMIDLQGSRHHFTFKIVHADDGSDVGVVDEPMVAPINYIAATLFESVHMYINQMLVTPSGGQNIPYRSYFEALLDSSRFKKTSEMQAALYYEDDAGAMGPNANPDDNFGNEGFKARAAFTLGSRKCHVVGPIPVDLCQQERLLLSGVALRFSFFPTRPEFHLMVAQPGEGETTHPGGYRLQITDAFLRIKKKTVVPSVLLGIEDQLRQKPALYPNMRTDVRKFLIHKGQLSFTLTDMFQGTTPSIMVVALVSEKASQGDVSLNPLEAKHCNITDLTCTLDDRNSGQPPMKMHFDDTSYLKSSYMDGFQSLFLKESGGMDEDSATYCGIDRKAYASGYPLFKFVFSSAATSRFLPLVSHGSLCLKGNFSKPIPENTYLIAYARFPALATLDKTRRVTI